MTIPAHWISQLTRKFVRINKLNPNEMDATDVRNQKYVSSSDSVTGDKNMKATFIFKSSGGNYQGSEFLTYKTVNLEKLFKNNSIPVVWGYNPHTTRDVAQLLIDQYGVPLLKEWVKEEPVDGSLLPTYFTIKTMSTDWCSESELTVRVEQSEKDVAELFTVDVLDAPQYIKYIKDPTFGECRDHLTATYGRDFTPRYTDEKEIMYNFVAGEQRIGYLAYPTFITFIQDVIGDAATIYDLTPNFGSAVTPGDILLNEYRIAYNGTTKNAKFNNVSADTSYDKILIVKPIIRWHGDREFTPMFLHYNDV